MASSSGRSEKFERSRTVRVLIFNEENKLLLVHEKGDMATPKYKPKRPKLPKWSLPGGSVDKSTEEALEQILKYLPVYNLPKESLEYILRNKPEDIDWQVFMIAIKECIEETGFMILPEKLLFSEETTLFHDIQFLRARIISGKLEKRSVETDDCGWFDPLVLPDMYMKYPDRIVKAMNLINIKTEGAKL